VFVVTICACPEPPRAGNFTPANSGSLLVTGIMPPFGVHHFLSPLFMSYAVTPPYSFGLRIETPPICENAPRLEKPSPCVPACFTYPGGVGSAPIKPQLSCGELYRNSEHGSFWSEIVLSPVWPPTYIIPVSGSAAAPPSMFTPPLAPGAYHEQR